jgi:hypothetical protein
MAYPQALNIQYKAEKAAGTTTAKSFPEWNALRLQAVEEAPVPEVAPIDTIDATLSIVEQALAVVEQTAKITKADLARQVYDAEVAAFDAANTPVVRKTIIDKFKAIVGLTNAGAATYYQNIRREHGLINS